MHAQSGNFIAKFRLSNVSLILGPSPHGEKYNNHELLCLFYFVFFLFMWGRSGASVNSPPSCACATN